MVKVIQTLLVRQWLGQNATRGNAIISVCSATPLGKHKENTDSVFSVFSVFSVYSVLSVLYVFDQNSRAIYQLSIRCLTDIFYGNNLVKK